MALRATLHPQAAVSGLLICTAVDTRFELYLLHVYIHEATAW